MYRSYLFFCSFLEPKAIAIAHLDIRLLVTHIRLTGQEED